MCNVFKLSSRRSLCMNAQYWGCYLDTQVNYPVRDRSTTELRRTLGPELHIVIQSEWRWSSNIEQEWSLRHAPSGGRVWGLHTWRRCRSDDGMSP